MTQVRKYAQLPDLDNAPDIYETPELTDDASTLQTSTARSPSPEPEDPAEEGTASGVNRGRLNPDRARNHFLPSRVDARDADFSDRVSSKKQSYKVSSRRRRDGSVIETENEDEGDYSDDEAEEGLERRLARLTREIEEVKSDYARRKEDESNPKGNDQDTKTQDTIVALSKALDNVRNSQRDAVSAHSRLAKQLSNPATTAPFSTTSAPAVPTPTPTTDQIDAETLSRIAAFDTRLATLEKALGLSSLGPGPTNDTTSIIPILPTLSLLDKQITLLTSSSTLPHLDALTEKLSSMPTKPAAATAAAETDTPSLTQEDMSKLRSLYALLPTLTAMSPTVPALLTRLRSLRQLHSGAAGASQLLDELEKRQEETDKEIAAWKGGVDRVEAAVRDAEEGMKANSGVVESWVKELEERLRGMGLE